MKNRKRHLGWIPNPYDFRDYPLTSILSTGDNDPLPESWSLRNCVKEVYDQGNTSSCVAQAVAMAIQVREVNANIPYVSPSRLFLYYHARRFHFGHLFDQGTYIRTAMKALTKFGVPNENNWPWSTSVFRVNRCPNWNAHAKAYGRAGGLYYTIPANVPNRGELVRRALYDDLPVVFGTSVTKSFLDNDGPNIIDVPEDGDPIIGGHAMAIIGYAEHPAYDYVYLVANSWGRDFRDDGLFWMTEKFLTWEKTRDLTAVAGWKLLQK